ncbi:MAG: membrane-bound lytic murein transglycosylase MltF [Gammaproteobacteria bacterium]|nr:membrane-bound lytic murein transglycosylase MltF [Gammaproteobacteria bacterium]
MTHRSKLDDWFRFNGRLHIFFTVAITLLFSSLISYIYISLKPTQLETVKSRGVIKVVTLNGPTTYYQGKNGPAGFEYDLAQAFADYLQVDLGITVASSHEEAMNMIVRQQSHFAATGLTATQAYANQFLFTTDYLNVKEQIIKRQGKPYVKTIEDLDGGRLGVLEGTSLAESLKVQKLIYNDLTWQAFDNANPEELLEAVSNKLLDYALVYSNEILLTRHFYPELVVAFDLNNAQKLSWAFRMSDDHSLYNEADRFLLHMKDNGQLAKLIERHYGHIETFNYSGTQLFNNRIETRLPKFQALFEKAGHETGTDWRLLAAIAHQESHWDPKAISPTGVRGLMMLTLKTARQMGIKSRLDPEDSVMGGARYFKNIRDRIHKKVEDPDRTWFALAAYNLGLGHIRDARKLAIKLNKNPNLWIDIKDILPLLTKRKWYKQTKYGYARGYEALQYVQNIRRYYDILKWKTTQHEEVSIDDFIDIP